MLYFTFVLGTGLTLARGVPQTNVIQNKAVHMAAHEEVMCVLWGFHPATAVPITPAATAPGISVLLWLLMHASAPGGGVAVPRAHVQHKATSEITGSKS